MWARLAGLQSPEAQHLLSELARCPAIRLLASMDHVNAPLLWDRRTAARFNWLYFDVTTYAPYHAEAQEMPSLLIGRRCAAGARSASQAARRPPNASLLLCHARGRRLCAAHCAGDCR